MGGFFWYVLSGSPWDLPSKAHTLPKANKPSKVAIKENTNYTALDFFFSHQIKKISVCQYKGLALILKEGGRGVLLSPQLQPVCKKLINTNLTTSKFGRESKATF